MLAKNYEQRRLDQNHLRLGFFVGAAMMNIYDQHFQVMVSKQERINVHRFSQATKCMLGYRVL